MTEQINALLEQLRSKSYRNLRNNTEGMPITYPIDFFGFHFGTKDTCIHFGGNVTPNYKRVITTGFDVVREELVGAIASTDDIEKKDYGTAMLNKLDECIAICDKYRETVKNHPRLYQALQKLPHKGAESFYEACLFMNICIYFLRLSGAEHLGLGRFDQYMYSFYEHDTANGVSEEEIFETLEAFFISLNFDADLYSGVQQGDNGQSLVLGGYDKDGNSVYNALSEMCLKASLELNLIDPKINLRVNKDTPDELFKFATRLTKQGLGFPQYSNDDVVVPGLVKLGYELDDAVDYAVAACWEFVIPNCGADIPNARVLNYPLEINRVLHESLKVCNSFEELMQYVEERIKQVCDDLVADTIYCPEPMPLLSIFIDGCIKTLTDMWRGGAKYRNYGCLCSGLSNAIDALAAVKQCVFEEKSVTAEELLRAMNENFEGDNELRNRLRACPKMGNNNDETNEIADKLMSFLSQNLNNRPNEYGGIWRAGTGSAQSYVFSASECPATADGRKAAEPYASSFSPSLDVKTNGLLSVIQSFTRYDMTDIINGGPLTLEIHDTVLKNEIGIEKTAQLVKLFIQLGGHQLQLNSVNRERLLDAQKHPEQYPNLIVRVWGWSGYFNELDVKFQNHIIRRCEYTN